jgi:hypothetical protein
MSEAKSGTGRPRITLHSMLAMAVYNEATRLDPKYAAAFYNRGIALECDNAKSERNEIALRSCA